MDNKNIKNHSADARVFALELKINTRSSLAPLGRETAHYLKILLSLKDTGALERRLTDERYAVLERGRAAAAALKKTKPMRAVSGVPLVVLFAREYLRSCSWRAQNESLDSFLSGFQSVCPLEHGELWQLSDVFAALIAVRLGRLAQKGGSVSEAEECLQSLRNLSGLKLKPLLRRHDLLDKTLCSDPAHIYEKMTRLSREEYCVLLARLAAKRRISEPEAAEIALNLASKGEGRKRHVGYYLINMPLGDRRKTCAPLIKTIIALAAAALTFCVCVLAKTALAAPFVILPLWSLCQRTVHGAAKRIIKPLPTPELDFSKHVSAEGKTVCAVSCLLTDEETAKSLASKLEDLYLANPECAPNVTWALLADLPDGDTLEKEEETRLIKYTARQIDRLNKLYSGGFMLFTRPRIFSRREGKYMASERKRGAIEELVGFLTAAPSAVRPVAGEPSELAGARFILALDSDTLPMPGSIAKLIGTLVHPLNRPVCEKGRVRSGWAVAVPRQEVSLFDSAKTPFARALAGRGGWDSYAPADARSLISRRSGFGGKGLIDIQTYKQCLWGKIPRGRVLSHDLLEGEYLRTLYVPAALFCDGFPTRVIPWSARLHRWTRGDWQCLPWVKGRIQVPGGIRHNPLSLDSRTRILENSARSLVLPSAFVLTLLALFGAVPRWLALISPIMVADSVKAAALSLVKYPNSGINALTNAKEQLLAAFLRLSLLAHESYVCLSAAVTALVRMVFTRRHLLQWVTAAQAAGAKASFEACLKKLWFSPVAGAVVLAAAENLWFAALGLLWIACPLTAWLYSKEAKPQQKAREKEKDWLLLQAKRMAAYFEDNMTPQHNFLPPDNVQTRPWKGAAARTSPTNIGLALLSCVAACKLGLWSEEKTAVLCENCLLTVSQLKKWKGHLYNWYSTDTLSPLAPGDISSVDSGNLCACAVAVTEALRQMEHPAAERAALLAKQLVDEMDFSPLYDTERRLFKISLRPGDRMEGSCYDLLASEARLACFTAVALGKADKRLWYSLSRARARAGKLRPLVSWSGTMFEYLMPRILLSEPRGSLLDRSSRDAVKTQRKTSCGLWGISESCFYSFDETLDYRYKAHGVQALALARCRDGERVISPYSSFLALDVEPEAAIENLLRLESMGAMGKWGLCEAVDMTSGRGAGGRGAIVSCHMAHHLGMSIASICNYLLDDELKKLFTQNPRIRAWQSLLCERACLTDRSAEPGLSYKPSPGLHAARPAVEDDGLGTAMSDSCLLSNGLFSIVCDRRGRQSVRCGGAEVTLEGTGWTAFDGEKVHSLTPGQGDSYSSLFGSDSFSFSSTFQDLELSLATWVVASQPGFVQKLSIKNTATEQKNIKLKISFTPVLEKAEAYYSHPAFSKLFLKAERQGAGVLVRRKQRSGGEGACLFAVLSRPGAKTELLRPSRNGDGLSDQCRISFEITVPVSAHSVQEVSFALCMGDEAHAAESGAKYCLERGQTEHADREREFSSLEGTAEFDATAALELLRRLQWPQRRGALAGRSELFTHGISGDLPIAAADAEDEDVQKLLLANRYLSFAGRSFDLVLFVPKEGYSKPQYHRLMGKMRYCGCETRLSMRGGVHLVSVERSKLISSLAQVRWPLEAIEPTPVRRCEEISRGKGHIEFSVQEEQAVLTLKNKLPEAVWSVPLANETFGTIAADCGLMGSWYKNARENRLTPWVNDPLATHGSETIEIITPGERISVFAAHDGWDTKVIFAPGSVRWIKTRGSAKIETEACVPPGVSARLITVKTEGLKDATGEYRSKIIMGSAMDEGFHTVYVPTVGGFEAKNLYNGDFQGQRAFILGCAAKTCGDGVALSFDAAEPARIVLGCAMTSDEERAIRELAAKGCQMTHTEQKAVQITTPAPEIDNYVNHWALYQTRVCRLWGRCSVYQCGGAYGFRDQLQDVCALLWSSRELAREHILRCCSKQFIEGDCAHWWHELSSGVSKGVRTLCSDDLLWLAYAAALYVDSTGDSGLFSESVPYLTSLPLKPGQKDRYEILTPSKRSGTVLEHCLAAVNCFLERGTGKHSLPLILAGDWNDGMDSVGDEGRGESVWLAWFAVCTLKMFAPHCPENEKIRLLEQASKLEDAARAAWDGQWYLRGYFDSGAPLGSKDSPECQIDSIAQGFAALAGVTDDKTQTALKSACKMLIKDGVVALFTPPFEGKGEFPGYISSYPAGVRENGGQYTHGAIWLAMGCLRAGLKDEGLNILRTIAPKGVYDEVYGAEPWVIAADVSLKKGMEGKAGWSWYTGSAGWFYRAVLEELLGLRLENGSVIWDAKRLPPGWNTQNVSITVKGKPITPGERVKL